MNRKICSFLMVILVFSCCLINTDPRASLKHGTLIVIVPTKDGLVVCGDKRLHNEETGQNFDTETKVRVLDNKTFYVASGLLNRQRSYGIGGNTYSFALSGFRLYEIIENWYKTPSTFDLFHPRVTSNEMSIFSFDPWRTLTSTLETELLLSKPLIESFGHAKEGYFVALFFRLEGNQVLMKGIQSSPLLANVVQSGEPLGLDLNMAKPIMLGAPDAYNELQNGSNNKFDALRIDPNIRPFLRDFRQRIDVTPNEALAFEIALIAATSQFGPELNPRVHVSKECNCGLLSFAEGFKWITTEEYPWPIRIKPTVATENKNTAEPAKGKSIRKRKRAVRH